MKIIVSKIFAEDDVSHVTFPEPFIGSNSDDVEMSDFYTCHSLLLDMRQSECSL